MGAPQIGRLCNGVLSFSQRAFIVSASQQYPTDAGMRLRIGIASLIGLAAADSSVAEYFISPYSEPAGLLGILAGSGITLACGTGACAVAVAGVLTGAGGGFCAGMELMNGYSELSDPDLQLRRFQEQAQAREEGDEEAQRRYLGVEPLAA